MEATVYILRCADGSYYTGLTKQPVEALPDLSRNGQGGGAGCLGDHRSKSAGGRE